MFFDPVDLLQPIILSLKVLFQMIFKQKQNWDDDSPVEAKTEFKKFMAALKNLGNVSVPKKVINLDDPVEHGFIDASFQNYGASSFSKVGFALDLITSKSRLSPMKKTTIPRLELLRNLLLSKLMTLAKIL